MSTATQLVPIGFGQRVDSRIAGDVRWIERTFKVKVTAGYDTTGHAANGEHPVGLAIDAVPDPARGGTWDDVDRLAKWAEPSQNHPNKFFRWVGYNGDPNHGRGNHIHLSWWGGPTAPDHPVLTITGKGKAPLVGAKLPGLNDTTGSLLGDVTNAATTDPSMFHAPLDAAGNAAAAAVTAVLGGMWTFIKDNAGGFLLKAAFIIGGAALAVHGILTLFGMPRPRVPLLPVPA